VKEELQFFLQPHNNRGRKNCSSIFNLITTGEGRTAVLPSTS
jgi:hypothetical protein